MPLQQINVSPLVWGKDPSSPDEQQEQKDPLSSKTHQSDHDASETSTLSMNYDICRICHCEGDSEIPLIAPCYCSGSLRYVHQACLQQWIKSSDIRSCELCKFQFIMQSKLKPFNEWENLEMSPVERRKLFCSVSFHVVALTCVVWSLYVLIDRTIQEIDHGILEWPFWTKLIVVAIGCTGGIVFMYIQCKAYMHLCRRWKAFNRVIFVQNAPEKQDPSLQMDTCCGSVLINTIEENANNPSSGAPSLGANNLIHHHHHPQTIEPILLPPCSQNPRYDLEKSDHDECGEMIHLLPKELVVEITPEAQSPLLPPSVSISQVHPAPNNRAQ